MLYSRRLPSESYVITRSSEQVFSCAGCGWWLDTEEGQEKDKKGLPQKQAGPASRQAGLAEALTRFRHARHVLSTHSSGSPTAPARIKKHCTQGASNTHGAQGSGPHASHMGNQLQAHTAVGSYVAKRNPSESSVKAQARQDPNTVLWALDVLMLIRNL